MMAGRGLILGRPLDTLRRSAIAEARALLNPSVSSADASNRFLRAIFPRMKQDGNYARLSNAVHTAVFAPTGAGKGVSCVIPFLLDCPDSCVVVDFKGELARATAAKAILKAGELLRTRCELYKQARVDHFKPVRFSLITDGRPNDGVIAD